MTAIYTYILIVVSSGYYGNSISFQEFEGEKSCQIAKQFVISNAHATQANVTATCMKKWEK